MINFSAQYLYLPLVVLKAKLRKKDKVLQYCSPPPRLLDYAEWSPIAAKSLKEAFF